MPAYNQNNISSAKLLNKVKNHKNNYNLEVTMYVKKSYKQRDNTWTSMKLDLEPVVYSKIQNGKKKNIIYIYIYTYE